MIFNTNSSLFSYGRHSYACVSTWNVFFQLSTEIRSTFDTNQQNKFSASAYMANPLSSCTVDAILATADLARRTIVFNVSLVLLAGPVRHPVTLFPDPYFLYRYRPTILALFNFDLSLNQYNPYYDDIVAYYIHNKPSLEGLGTGRVRVQRNTASLDNIIGILDAVSTDLFAALYIVSTNASTNTTPAVISLGGFLACPEAKNTACKPEDMIMTIPASELSYPNGTYVTTQGIGTFLAPIQQSFLNVFTVLRDAYQYVCNL